MGLCWLLPCRTLPRSAPALAVPQFILPLGRLLWIEAVTCDPELGGLLITASAVLLRGWNQQGII